MAESRNKYGNKPAYVGNKRFDSTKEAYYYMYYRSLEKDGKIRDLRMQVPYEIIPACGKQKAVHYVADFVYVDPATGGEVVVDVKSPATAKKEAYVLKKKMMYAFNGIVIKEVY